MAELRNAADGALAARFFDAAGSDDAAAMQALLAEGAEIDGAYKNVTPLMHAARGGKGKAVALLIDAGADILLENVDGADAKCLAADAGHRNIVNLITRNAQARDERVAAQKAEDEFRRNLDGIVSAVKGGIETDVPVWRPLRLKGGVNG